MIKMNYKKPCIISLGKFSDLSILMAVRFPIKVLLWSQKGFFLKSSFHCKKKSSNHIEKCNVIHAQYNNHVFVPRPAGEKYISSVSTSEGVLLEVAGFFNHLHCSKFSQKYGILVDFQNFNNCLKSDFHENFSQLSRGRPDRADRGEAHLNDVRFNSN